MVAKTATEHEDEVTRLATEHEEELTRLRDELEAEAKHATELRQTLDAQLQALQGQLADRGGDGTLRAEVQELSAQLDDERLKSMALQRALERFAAMGGTIPKQAEADATRS